MEYVVKNPISTSKFIKSLENYSTEILGFMYEPIPGCKTKVVSISHRINRVIPMFFTPPKSKIDKLHENSKEFEFWINENKIHDNVRYSQKVLIAVNNVK